MLKEGLTRNIIHQTTEERRQALGQINSLLKVSLLLCQPVFCCHIHSTPSLPDTKSVMNMINIYSLQRSHSLYFLVRPSLQVLRCELITSNSSREEYILHKGSTYKS